jgi:predicted alpha-1,2-mannosidase
MVMARDDRFSAENPILLSSNPVQPGRRRFLKASGLAAAATAISPVAFAASPEPHSGAGTVTDSKPMRPLDAVNLLQGSQSTPVFSHGNTLPIATAPFGMAHWTIQTQANTPWMFQPWARRTQGFRCTHQLSPWLDDYGHAVFMPFRGNVHADASPRASSYVPEDAVLTPYSLQLFLLRYRAKVELVPTERCCVLSADFEAPDPADTDQTIGLILDVPATNSDITAHKKQKRVQFTSTASSGGTPDNFATYYVVEFVEPWDSFEVQPHSDHQKKEQQVAVVKFKSGMRLEARIGTSFISFEQALFNLHEEVGERSQSAVKEATEKHWSEMLERIEIEGATAQQQRTFYSCLYRTLLFPRTFHEPVPGGKGMHHYSAFTGKISPGVMYADHGYWDVYRAWYPLMSIVFPEKLSEILQAWVNALNEGGWFPQFPAPGYRACMSGSLIDSLFADAIVKGIGSFDREVVFAGLKKHATMPGDPDKGYGRVGVEKYMKLHYVPADQIEQSVAETADAAYGDFCIAQIAKILGKSEDYATFMARSAYWRNVYDTGVGFFRGKNADGSWLSPFDSFTWGSPYEEGSAWQHRWDAPHAVKDLFEALGGKAAAVDALEKMVTVPPIFHVGVYGGEIHEMSEMAAVPFGQYAHSNQPSHHMLYLFAEAGRPDRTQFWVRRTLNELYSPDSFAGDEDTGSMAAWYILSSLGFYQVCPGVPEYTIGAPLFPQATVHLPGGKTLKVRAEGNSADTVYVEKVSLNGEARTGRKLSHREIAAGGTLLFRMTAQAPKTS